MSHFAHLPKINVYILLALPTVTVFTDNIIVSILEDVTFICSATGGNTDIYTYTWTHVDTSTVLTQTSPSLNLPRVTMEQLGTYMCAVRNEVGVGANTIAIRLGSEFESQHFHLMYNHWLMSTLFSVAPEVTTRVNPPGSVIKGSTVNLVCEATAGDLPISYSWTNPYDITLLSNSNMGTVLINSLRDYGEYTCTANNQYGGDTSTLTVEQAGMYHTPQAAVHFIMLPAVSSFKIALGLLINLDCKKWIVSALVCPLQW